MVSRVYHSVFQFWKIIDWANWKSDSLILQVTLVFRLPFTFFYFLENSRYILSAKFSQSVLCQSVRLSSKTSISLVILISNETKISIIHLTTLFSDWEIYSINEMLATSATEYVNFNTYVFDWMISFTSLKSIEKCCWFSFLTKKTIRFLSSLRIEKWQKYRRFFYRHQSRTPEQIYNMSGIRFVRIREFSMWFTFRVKWSNL